MIILTETVTLNKLQQEAADLKRLIGLVEKAMKGKTTDQYHQKSVMAPILAHLVKIGDRAQHFSTMIQREYLA